MRIYPLSREIKTQAECEEQFANRSKFEKMRSVYMYLSLDSAEEAEKVHNLLADGGEIFMPMEETFYATRFSMLRDRFGVSWTIINERPVA